MMLALAVLLHAAVSAQQTKAKYDEKILFQESASAAVGASVHSWTIGDDAHIGQGTYPLTVTIPAGERFLFSMSAVAASVRHGETAISGIPETRLSVSTVLPGEKLWVTGAVSVPTGVTRLSNAQTALAAALAQPTLGYRMPSMGQGLNTTLGCAYATAVSRGVVFGFGGAASFKGRYEPVAPADEYTLTYAPGNELAANIGIDLRDGMKTNRFSADYTLTYYLADKVNGEKYFRSGVKAAFVLLGSHVSAYGIHALQMRAELRARNVTIAGTREEESPSAQHYAAEYSLTLPVREKLALTASAEVKTMTSDQFPVNGKVLTTGGGTIGTLAAECRYAAASSWMLSAHFGFGAGTITFLNADRRAFGFDAGAGVKYSF